VLPVEEIADLMKNSFCRGNALATGAVIVAVSSYQKNSLQTNFT
jgi:hypothetical protein